MNKPDNWILLRMPEDSEYKDEFKVLGGWSGGYLDGDSWKLNSGIERYSEEGDYINFYGFSGSCYKCHKDSEQVRMNIAGILSTLEEKGFRQISYKEFKNAQD